MAACEIILMRSVLFTSQLQGLHLSQKKTIGVLVDEELVCISTDLALFKVAKPEELARQNRELESLLRSHPKGIA